MSTQLTVLIVDDSELNRHLLERLVGTLGHAVKLAANGLEAVEFCQTNRPDMILMDINMPVMNGYEATEAIRKHLGEDWLPIIFLTALSDKTSLMKGLEIGGDDYLTKPIDFALLSAKINALLRIDRLQKRISADSLRLAAYYEANEEEQRLANHILARFNTQSDGLHAHVQQWLKPALSLSGDVICVMRSPTGNDHIMLADSTGHGLAAAICCLPAVSTFVAMTKSGFGIGTITREINDKLNHQLPSGRFVAAALVSIDYLEHVISVWNGGIPCVIYMNAEGALERKFDCNYLALGILSDAEFDGTVEVHQWEQEGQLILGSDGVTEAGDAKGTHFGLDGIINAARNAKLHDTAATISRAMLSHLGEGDNHDDASLLLVNCSESYASVAQKASVPSKLAHLVSANWEIKLSFTAVQLRQHDCFQAIVSWLNQIGLDQNQFSVVLLVLSELFNNALDHGILGLSSKIKSEEGGFEKYLNLRQERLSTLKIGEISIGLSRNQADSPNRNPPLQLWLSDTGTGFDYSGLNSATADGSVAQVHGRGLALIAQMCESLRFVGNGNRVEATFAT